MSRGWGGELGAGHLQRCFSLSERIILYSGISAGLERVGDGGPAHHKSYGYSVLIVDAHPEASVQLEQQQHEQRRRDRQSPELGLHVAAFGTHVCEHVV